MAISLSSFLIPRNSNTFFLLEDKYLKGGLRVVDSLIERDSINPLNRKEGMIVVDKSSKKLYQLQADLESYLEVSLGGEGGGTPLGSRQTVVYITPTPLEPLGFVDVTLNMGKSALVQSLSVDKGPCKIEAFSRADRSDSNPYTFVASAEHLEDDGTTFNSDGSVNYGRRYTIVSNLEPVPTSEIYWRITNIGDVQNTFALSILFLPLE